VKWLLIFGFALQLIQFLVTLVQPSQRLNPKRRLPLMLNNVPHPTTDTKSGLKGRSDFADLTSNGAVSIDATLSRPRLFLPITIVLSNA